MRKNERAKTFENQMGQPVYWYMGDMSEKNRKQKLKTRSVTVADIREIIKNTFERGMQ